MLFFFYIPTLPMCLFYSWCSGIYSVLFYSWFCCLIEFKYRNRSLSYINMIIYLLPSGRWFKEKCTINVTTYFNHSWTKKNNWSNIIFTKNTLSLCSFVKLTSPIVKLELSVLHNEQSLNSVNSTKFEYQLQGYAILWQYVISISV